MLTHYQRAPVHAEWRETEKRTLCQSDTSGGAPVHAERRDREKQTKCQSDNADITFLDVAVQVFGCDSLNPPTEPVNDQFLNRF